MVKWEWRQVNDTQVLVVFTLDQRRYALPLPVVQRVVHAVEITPLPQAPAIVLGVINVQGQIIPVVNLRRRFGLPDAVLNIDDQIIIAHPAKRRLGLVVNRVTDILTVSATNLIASARILPDLAQLEGVVKLEDDLILVHNLDAFLSLDEANTLQAAWQGLDDKAHF